VHVDDVLVCPEIFPVLDDDGSAVRVGGGRVCIVEERHEVESNSG
jgi:hypothetical protein